MKNQKKFYWLHACTVLFLLSTTTCFAETFTARVKVTLIDPANAAKISEQQAMHLPLKRLKNGHCSIDPATGILSGTVCSESTAQTSTINIDGQEALNIAVNLSESQSPELHFAPTLFNGQDQQNNFKLTTDEHTINIGGTVTQTSAGFTKEKYTNKTSTYSQQSAQLNYGIEILYP